MKLKLVVLSLLVFLTVACGPKSVSITPHNYWYVIDFSNGERRWLNTEEQGEITDNALIIVEEGIRIIIPFSWVTRIVEVWFDKTEVIFEDT